MDSSKTPRIKKLQEQLKNKIDSSSTFEITVHRSSLLKDSVKYSLNSTPNEYLKQLNICFIEENGDITRSTPKDWLNLLSKEILSPENNLFVHSQNNTYYPSTKSCINEDNLNYFKFSGIVYALSIIYDASVQISFSPFFVKQILHIPIEIEDLNDYDSHVYDSFQYMQKHDAENIQIYFETCIDGPEGRKNVELIPNGSNIKISEENKNEYIKLMIDFLLYKSISEQIKSFIEGFYSIIQFNDIQSFTPKELNYLIFGSSKIDIEMLKKNIKISQPYTLETPIIKNFFNVISKWDNEDLRRLLYFVTGYANFIKNKEIFTIEKVENSKMLPIAHTVIKTLELPEYENEEELNKKLLLAIRCASELSDNECI